MAERKLAPVLHAWQNDTSVHQPKANILSFTFHKGLKKNIDFDTTTLLRTTFVFTLLGLILAAAQLVLYVIMFFRYQERRQVLMIAAVALLAGSVFCFAISTGLYFDSVLANTGSWLLATTWVTVVVLTTAVIYVFIDWEESGK
ncbi:hypothetical protein CSKR_203060 [Clonorchis sinensis]|uniref:Uncharacterized protein n=1 Tax=Clonorchis sinensis TaxID=79923 RepID=A0A8T1M6V8_CLOSI|nr:hypothetical protein CSKR_203060 [Clonorchis sinensis]